MSRRFSLTTRALLPALATLALAAPPHAATASGGAPSKTPSDPTAALAQEQYYSSYGTPAKPSDAAPLAQEQYYGSYGTPTPTPSHIRATESAGDDGVAPVPFILTTLGALVAGIGAGSGLHRVQLRRRRAAGLAA
jgi:hypothetical protein